MIDRSTNCKAFFRQSVKEFFKFETGKLDSKIYEVHKAHSEWILSIGWNDKSNYLEKIAMLFSEFDVDGELAVDLAPRDLQLREVIAPASCSVTYYGAEA